MFLSLLKFFTISILAATQVFAAQNFLQKVTNFGTNPTNVGMYVYLPTGLVSSPALIVAVHYCTGTAQAYFSGTQYANLADHYKTFLIVYPNAPDRGGCWDVHTKATLTHNAGGDSQGIASMVHYAVANYGVDSSRVFVTGGSSGGMMTNVLVGAYPDLFKAASAWCGVPYGCFAGPDMWNSACAQGKISKTAQEWGDLVRSGDAGYTGPRPKMQIWHGTADQVLDYNNFGEAIKEWTNVFGYSTTPASTEQNNPLTGWTRSTYGPNFQAISAQDVGHDIPNQANEVLAWFGLTGSTATIAPMTPTTPKITSGGIQTHHELCGG
ncbi:carbohydrate esterase family 1 protein [Flammula alnicola]|nr:carbohydrate esterase family 1 protein [Flammula alnicola]